MEGMMEVKCRDCDAPYGKYGWVDVCIPDETWNIICPEDGVLCFRCMTKRIEALGIEGVPVIVSSGPYRDANEVWRMAGWDHGYKVGRAEREAERDRLREALEACNALCRAIDAVRKDLGTQYPALSEAYIVASTELYQLARKAKEG
jgi:hypothetical protein